MTNEPQQGSNDTLTEEQKTALFIHHKRRVKNAAAKVEAAKNALKAVEKVAKDDLGKDVVKDIKLAIQIETPEGEATARAELERRANVFRMMAIGTQVEMFDDGHAVPSEEAAFVAGRLAGMEGEPASPPHAPGSIQSNAWLSGHTDGVTLMRWAQKMDDERAFDAGAKVKGGGGTDADPEAGEEIGDADDTASVG